jgi:hypothetical protein
MRTGVTESGPEHLTATAGYRGQGAVSPSAGPPSATRLHRDEAAGPHKVGGEHVAGVDGLGVAQLIRDQRRLFGSWLGDSRDYPAMVSADVSDN